ncbi:hypothetical protein ACS5PK_21040 [Roseateles sp. DB2]|uniref:hypothetical protein n=1 Tax=Roseateles sp. DB2 TaxID=3453717 RepID=UPI003EE9E22C
MGTSTSQDSEPASLGAFARWLQLLAALTPILVVCVGAWINVGINSARQQIDSQALKTAAGTTSVNIKTQVDKVRVIADFLSDPTGKDEIRREVAFEAINIVLPAKEAQRIKLVVLRSDTRNARAADGALQRGRQRLLTDMFSQDQSRRRKALGTLQEVWSDDDPLMDMLLDGAEPDLQARKASGWAEVSADLARQQLASLYNTAKCLAGTTMDDARLVNAPWPLPRAPAPTAMTRHRPQISSRAGEKALSVSEARAVARRPGKVLAL